MRKITRKALDAFNNNRPFKQGNTCVEIDVLNMVSLLLHDFRIAWKTNCATYINDRGWQTNTTKERLNAIDGVYIYQKNFTWYLSTPKHDNIEMIPNKTYEV